MITTRPPLRVGILGLGTIGRAMATALAKGVPGAVLAGATGRDAVRARQFLETLAGMPPYLRFPELIEATDFVLEAATREALEAGAPRILEAGRDLLVVSVGALLDHPEWIGLASAHGARIHVPSCAIAGLDGLKGASVQGHLDSAVTGVFEGTAREACRAFPANVNVVAAVSLAGLGPDRTGIRILADGGVSRNRHTVTAEGAFGRFRIEMENVPSANPRTGKLAYLSVIAYLRDLRAPLRVGT